MSSAPSGNVEHKSNRTFTLGIEASRILAQEAKDRNVSANAIITELILQNLRGERG